MPKVVPDVELARRVQALVAELGGNVFATARELGVSRGVVERLSADGDAGVVAKTRDAIEQALAGRTGAAADVGLSKRSKNVHQTGIPELASEVMRFVMEAVEARRTGDASNTHG